MPKTSMSSVHGRRRSAIGSALVAGVIAASVLQAAPASAATAKLRVTDTAVTEWNSPGQVARVKITLSKSMSRAVTVRYSTRNGSARAGADYTAKSGTVRFRPGQRAKVVNIPIVGDRLDEANETFQVRLSSPVRADIADRTGNVAIRDNDAAPSVAVADAEVDEPNTGANQVMSIPVQLSAPSGRPVSVAYAISPGTAAFGADYTAVPTSGRVTFPAGTTTQMVNATVVGDNTDETDETLNVSLVSPVNAVIADGTGLGTIRDQDGPHISVGNMSRVEGWLSGNMYHFNVSLNHPSPQEVRVSWATQNGTASSLSDFTAASGTLVFAPGQTTKTASVAVRGDIATESTETFGVQLHTPVNAAIQDGHGVGTIFNDDCTSTDEGWNNATSLGNVSGDTGSGTASMPSNICVGDSDWYRVQLREDNSDLFTSRDLTARIHLDVAAAPAQTTGDLTMCVYRSNLTLVGCSANFGASDEQLYVKKNDADFVWDHTDVLVKVFGVSGAQMNSYNLSVSGNVPTGIAPNL